VLLNKQTATLLSLKQLNMSRLKQNQNIDKLIQSITLVTQSQCSLSEQDKIVLNEASERLKNLRRKKGRTNHQILEEFAKVIVLLTKFFVETDS